MHAIEVPHFGGPEVLELRERPDPVAAAGQVVIDVAAVPLLWLDTALRSGAGRDWFPVAPPFVPGTGVAGRVAAVGEAVDGAWIGRAVLADTGQTGAYAERVAVGEDAIVPIPDGISAITAAALLTDGRTAMRLVESLDVTAERAVLITGAAGGMGLLLVQLCKARGARVVGAARGERKLAAIRAQGADAAVDYSQPDWTAAVLAGLRGRRPDVVFDGAGGELGRAAFDITARGGAFSAHGVAAGGFGALDAGTARKRDVAVHALGDVQLSRREARRYLEQALAEAAAGRLAPVIDTTRPLRDAAAAHARIEAREVVGKSLLIVDGRAV